MTQRPFKTGLIFASWAMLLIFGCHKKKPPVPQEAPPPAIQQPAQAQPEPTPSPTPTPTPEQQQATNTSPEGKPTPAHRSRTHPVKKTPANGEKSAAAGAEKPATGTGEKPTTEAKNIPPPKVIIQEGGANSTTSQVSSGQKENTANQPTTEQLLKNAEDNLRNLKRDLSDSEKSTKNQILDYITQSRKATEDADPVRAHTLALKARLLSDELVKSK